MVSVTLSGNYRLTIPKAIRDELGLKPGQTFTVFAKGSAIELVPVRSIGSARGMLKGADPKGCRDREDRY